MQRPIAQGLTAGAPLSRLHGPQEALALVAGPLAEAELTLRGLVTSNVSEITAISQYLMASGGKRLRPALTGLGALTIGYDRPFSDLMCVGELIHLGSLLHDDVVDGAAERRGRPAAHLVAGNAATILSGDFCLARAMLLASESGGGLAGQELARAVTEMAEGEVMQLRWAGELSCETETYLKWVERKSAALIAWCVAAPAWATENTEQARALSAFGRGVGVAFQLTDDVLDYRSDTGKIPGADLRERKVTMPLLRAMQVDVSIREQLMAGPPDEAAVIDLMGRVQATGALEYTLAKARSLVAESELALRSLPATQGREALKVLGRYLVERIS
jgi:octaprenyl-diphosphate synthase